MPLRGKSVDLISLQDLRAIVADKVLEGKTIEYKEALPRRQKDEAGKQFLRDVSSFANAAGGDLIYGIREKNGEPVEIKGLQIQNTDEERLRLENMIRDGIEPRIPGITIRPITEQGITLLIIRIPKSWSQPHAVTYRKHWRFYSRNSGGAYALDVPELRTAFVLSETASERIRNFRAERLNRIAAGEVDVIAYDGPRIILHLIPLMAFDPAANYPVSALDRDRNLISPLFYGGMTDFRYNFEGIMSYTMNEKLRSYTQFFRNGIVEVGARIFNTNKEPNIFPATWFEDRLLANMPRLLLIQKSLGISPPIFVMLSLLGLRDLKLGDDYHVLDRDSLILPEVMIDSFDNKLEDSLKPIFDAVWNSANWPKCMSYDESGRRIKPQIIR